ACPEMCGGLGPGGLLFLAFPLGVEVMQEENCWGHEGSLDLVLFGRKQVERYLGLVGFAIEDSLERDPYAPQVEYQSRRAYIRACKPTQALVEKEGARATPAEIARKVRREMLSISTCSFRFAARFEDYAPEREL